MKEYNAVKLIDEQFVLGEGPYYDCRYNRLSWVDILDKKIHTLKDDGAREVISLSQMAGAAIPVRYSEGFLACMEDGLYVVEDGVEKLVRELTDVYLPHERSNDAKCDPMGRLWFGSSSGDDSKGNSGNLFCLDNGEVSVKVPNTLISNGMAWNMERTKFYFSDSPRHAVFVYDYNFATGKISNEQVLFWVDEKIGTPDGLCIDADDNIWLAIWGGNRVECHDGRTGELLATVHVPGKQSSSCCFGGEDLKTLYITTAGIGLEGPDEGGLYYCKVDATGVEPDLYNK